MATENSLLMFSAEVSGTSRIFLPGLLMELVKVTSVSSNPILPKFYQPTYGWAQIASVHKNRTELQITKNLGFFFFLIIIIIIKGSFFSKWFKINPNKITPKCTWFCERNTTRSFEKAKITKKIKAQMPAGISPMKSNQQMLKFPEACQNLGCETERD